MNERILAEDNRVIKRVFSVDTLTYQEGASPKKTKELLGLSTSMVLRWTTAWLITSANASESRLQQG